MSPIHNIRRVILKNGKYVSVISSSQDNIINGKLDKTDRVIYSPEGIVVVGGYDPDSEAFFTAAGITDDTQKDAVDFLVKSFKGTELSYNPTGVNLWTDTQIIYPFVGGTATSHKWNLKNPLDTDAAFRIVFAGGLTHSANGILGNSVNGSGNTFYKPFVNGSTTEMSFSRYFRKNTSATLNSFIGCFKNAAPQCGAYEFIVSSPGLHTQDAGIGNYNAQINTAIPSCSVPKTSVARRESTTNEWFNNGVSKATKTAAGTDLPNVEFNLFQLMQDTGTGTGSHDNEIAFFHMGLFGTSAKAQLVRTIVDQYQVMLGRNV